MNKIIQVFEHQSLKVGEKGFEDRHFKLLVKYNDKNKHKYFSVWHNKIKFKNYVGVIKCGNLSIEILPKADREEDDTQETKNLWQKVLIDMLRMCTKIKINAARNTKLKIHSNKLLDIIYTSFIAEVYDILHTGKIKKYRREIGNTKTLKGRLIFSNNICKNITNKTNSYTEHQIYDSNEPLNKNLKAALEIASKTADSKDIKNKSKALLLGFEGIDIKTISKNDFNNIRYNRNTAKYENAIELSRLIIFNYQPALASGKHNVISMLFDMNKLFEEYVYQLLRRKANSEDWGYSVSSQNSKRLWGTQQIRPDIILNNKKTESKYVIDAKWKLPKNNKPTAEDLKQMFTYNIHFGATHSCLVYPYTSQKTKERVPFEYSLALKDKYKIHYCQIIFLDILNKDMTLNKDAAVSIYENLSEIKDKVNSK